jgi:hypothetical protein
MSNRATQGQSYRRTLDLEFCPMSEQGREQVSARRNGEQAARLNPDPTNPNTVVAGYVNTWSVTERPCGPKSMSSPSTDSLVETARSHRS